MDQNEYIKSGVLQDYCLGFLTDDEERKVEAMCLAYPKVAQELQLQRLALEKYSGNKKIRRKERLRRSIWEAIKKIWN